MIKYDIFVKSGGWGGGGVSSFCAMYFSIEVGVTLPMSSPLLSTINIKYYLQLILLKLLFFPQLYGNLKY